MAALLTLKRLPIKIRMHTGLVQRTTPIFKNKVLLAPSPPICLYIICDCFHIKTSVFQFFKTQPPSPNRIGRNCHFTQQKCVGMQDNSSSSECLSSKFQLHHSPCLTVYQISLILIFSGILQNKSACFLQVCALYILEFQFLIPCYVSLHQCSSFQYFVDFIACSA